MNKKQITVILTTLIAISLVMGLSAFTSDTGVAHTAPTATPLPASASAVGPKIVSDQNTNCRLGPSMAYTIHTVFMKGMESTVKGRNKDKNWWYIVSPKDASQSCWVWEGSTTVVGDASTLPVIEAPAATKSSSRNNKDDICNTGYFCSVYGNCCGDFVYNGNYYHSFWQPCGPNRWWSCDANGDCTCEQVCKTGECKPRSCPPVTPTNYLNYCQKYPKCCE